MNDERNICRVMNIFYLRKDSIKQFKTQSSEIATAIASYSASGPEQLSLQPGHLIQVRKKTDTGWWEGELQVGWS